MEPDSKPKEIFPRLYYKVFPEKDPALKIKTEEKKGIIGFIYRCISDFSDNPWVMSLILVALILAVMYILNYSGITPGHVFFLYVAVGLALYFGKKMMNNEPFG
jgi:hypothetical protein